MNLEDLSVVYPEICLGMGWILNLLPKDGRYLRYEWKEKKKNCYKFLPSSLRPLHPLYRPAELKIHFLSSKLRKCWVLGSYQEIWWFKETWALLSLRLYLWVYYYRLTKHPRHSYFMQYLVGVVLKILDLSPFKL